jgi:hypothetical protein
VKLDAPFGPRQLGREWLWLQARMRERAGVSSTETSPLRMVIATITRRPLGNAELRARIVADLRALGSTEPGPTEQEVRAATWHEMARWILDTDVAPTEPHVAAVLDDLDYFLRSRGLRLPPFESWPTPARHWPTSPTWYSGSYFSDLAHLVGPSRWRSLSPSFYTGCAQ